MLKKGSWLFCIGLCLGASLAFSESKKTFEGFLEFQSLYFFRSNTEYFKTIDRKEQFYTFGIGGKWAGESSQKSYLSDIAIFKNQASSQIYFYIKDLYYNIKSKDKNLFFGRKQLGWFEHEELWHNGLWSTRYRWDPIRPINQGVIGLVSEYFFDDFIVKWFVSPINLPELEPRLIENKKENSFRSENPWFLPFPKTLEVFDQERQLDYTLDTSGLFSDLYRPGLGFYLSYKPEPYSNLSFAYSYKAAYQFLQAALISLPIESTEKINVEITPQIFYHHLISVELKRKKNKWEFWQNFTYEQPNLYKDTKEDLIFQKRVPALFSISYLGYEFSENKSAYLSYHFLYQDFNDGRANPIKKELFESAYLYFNAIGGGLRYVTHLSSSRFLEQKFKWIYDFEQKGGIFSWDINFQLNKSTTLFLLVEMIGLFAEPEESLDKNYFLKDFRANDRIQGGVHYTF